MTPRRNRRPLRLRTAVAAAAMSATALVGGGLALSLTTGADHSVALRAETGRTLTVGQPVSIDLKPVVAEAAGGTLPADATLQITGLPDGIVQDGWVLSGVPTVPGTYDVLVTVTALGQTASRNVPLTVAADGAAPSGTTAPAGTATPAPTPTSGATTPTATTGTSGTTGTSPTTSSPTGGTTCSTRGGSVDPGAIIAAAGPALGVSGDQKVLAGILGTIATYLPSLLGADAGSLGCAAQALPGAATTTVPTSGATSGATSPAAPTPGAQIPGVPPEAAGVLAIVGPLLGVDTSSVGGR